MSKILIAGGGYRGIVAAYLLRRSGHRVVLVERAPVLGGVLYSGEWGDFVIDKGCHLLSDDGPEITRVVLDILEHDIIPVPFSYASVTAGTKTDGFAIPDLSVLGRETQQACLLEILEAAAAGPAAAAPAASLHETLFRRFGPTATGCLAEAARKMLRADPRELAASAMSVTNFERVKVVDDQVAGLLKQLPALDARLAVSSQGDPFRFMAKDETSLAHRNFYPAKGGMRAFCEAAARRLAAMGVELRFGTSLTSLEDSGDGLTCGFSDGRAERFDRMVWGLDLGLLAQLIFGDNPLAELTHAVPMVLYYFLLHETTIGPYTYLHDFSSNHLLFRASAMGRYSGQLREDGTTFVCCEVTTEKESAIWQDAEGCAAQVWREACELGFACGNATPAFHCLKTPVSYRVGRIGYDEILAALTTRIEAASDRIALDKSGGFFRSRIFEDLARLIAA